MLDESVLIYNGYDVANTLQCKQEIWKATPGIDRTYDFTMRLLDPLMYMMTRGVKVDFEKLDVLRKSLHVQIDRKQIRLNELCGRELNVNSPKDCQTYFYVEKGIPPYYNSRRVGGTYKRSVTTDDKAMQRIARGTAARKGLYEATLVQDIRGMRKMIGTYLDMDYDKDGRLRCSYNPRGCLLGETKVLTRVGWIRLDEYKEGTEIMQWKEDGTMSWTIPKLVSYDCDEAMYRCTSEQHECVYTNDHRIPTYTPHYLVFAPDRTAEDISTKQRIMPVSGRFSDGSFNSPLTASIIAMIQADGCITDGSIILNFKKVRKVERCSELLQKAGIKYTLPRGNEGYTRFCIGVKEAKDFISLLGKEKLYGSWLLNYNAETMDAFLEELSFWDAEITNNGYRYSCIHKTNVEWVQTIAHIRNKKTHITELFKEQVRRPVYRISIQHKKTTVALKPRYWDKVHHKGKVYCLITDTSFFLAKYNDHVFVTGNTKFGRLSSSKTIFGTGMNMQNLPLEFKGFLVPDPGNLMWEIDKKGAEWVAVAYLSGDANMIKVIEEGLDPHAYTAHLMTGLPIELIKEEDSLIGHTNDPSLVAEGRAKLIKHSPANQHAYEQAEFLPRTMTIRQCGKKSNHGLNYDEGYKMFALINEMLEGEAKRICHMYKHTVYPGVNLWHKSIQNKLQQDRTLTNCFGRSMRFLGRWDDKLFKEAYSFLPQSTVVDIVNSGMEQTYYDTRPDMMETEELAQVHDSIMGQTELKGDYQKMARVFKTIGGYMEPTIEYGGREFTIQNELKIGIDNWMELQEVDIYASEEELANQIQNIVEK